MTKSLTEKWSKETNPTAYSDFLFKQNEDLRKENKSLQEQLKEANRLIKVDAYGEGWEKAKRYIKKWGVK